MQPHKDIRYLKGVGEKRAKLYEKLGITDLATLLEHYPRSYIDLTQPVSIAGAPREEAVPVRAAVVSKTGEQRIRRGLSLFLSLIHICFGCQTRNCVVQNAHTSSRTLRKWN